MTAISTQEAAYKNRGGVTSPEGDEFPIRAGRLDVARSRWVTWEVYRDGEKFRTLVNTYTELDAWEDGYARRFKTASTAATFAAKKAEEARRDLRKASPSKEKRPRQAPAAHDRARTAKRDVARLTQSLNSACRSR